MESNGPAIGIQAKIWNSSQDLVNHVAMHIRESTIDAILSIGQSLVVNSQEVQDGGMEIVAVRAALDCLVTPFVALAVAGTLFHARSGQPADE